MTRIPIIMMVFFLAQSVQINAQKKDSGERVIVDCLEGTVLVGTLIDQNISKITVVSALNDTFSVQRSHIKKIRFLPNDLLMHSKGKYHYTSGYFGGLDFGGHSGGAQANIYGGKRFNKKWSAGIGIGSTIFRNTRSFRDLGFTAYYALGTYYLTETKARIFASIAAGYGTPNREDFGGNFSGGFYAQPRIGLHFASKKSIRFVLSVGQIVQYSDSNDTFFDSFSNPVLVESNIWYNRTSFRFGIEFR